MSKKKNIAGMSLGGGKKENFFFCLLEFFEDSQRWFLTSVHQVADEDDLDGDEAITTWVEKYGLTKLVVDFPMSRPPCDTCTLTCPGTKKCHHEVVVGIREKMKELIDEDKALMTKNPKKYEQQRVEDNMVHYSRSIHNKAPSEHLLSRSFKRKLKKGFIPYWHRPVDFFIWKSYYDQLLTLFKVSYDSFSNVSMMLISKFKYLLRHLPKDLEIYESQANICLLELHRSGIISKNHILNLFDIDQGVIARLEIIRAIEKKLNVFIYENDLELIVKKPKAFESFILALSGKQFLTQKAKEIPKWAMPEEVRFLIPEFSNP